MKQKREIMGTTYKLRTESLNYRHENDQKKMICMKETKRREDDFLHSSEIA